MEAVARDNPGHALELVEVVLVGHESVSQAPEDGTSDYHARKQEPDEPVGFVGMSWEGAETEADLQRTQPVDTVR